MNYLHNQKSIVLLIRLTKFASLLIAIALVVFSVWQLRNSPIFDFRFNIYGLLSLLAIVTNSVLLIIINRRPSRSPETFWFSLFLIEVVYWAVCECAQRFSATAEGAIFWYSLTPFGWIALGITLFVYALTMTESFDKLRSYTGILTLVGMPVLFLILTLQTTLVISYDSKFAYDNPWGYYVPYGPLFTLFLIWFEIFLLSSLLIIYKQYKLATNPIIKRRAFVNVIALLVPTIGGTFTDGILPILHIKVLPVAVLLTTAMAVIIGYATVRYKIFNANPALVAGNILSGMNESVLIVSNELRVEYANAASGRLFGYNENLLAGKDLSDLFHPEEYDQVVAALRENHTPDKHAERYEITNQDGKQVPALVSIDTIDTEEANRPAYVLVLTDVSAIEKVMKENESLDAAKRAMMNALEDAQLLEQELEREKASVEKKVIERTEQLTQEHARLQASINSLQVGFIITTDKQAVLSANTAAHDILSTPSAKTLEDFTKRLDGSLDLKAKVSSVFNTRKPLRIKDVLLGSHFLQIFITPILIAPDRAIGTAILIEDITEEKALQRSRDEFFSIASHELRTPLTAIRGNTSLIKNYYQEQLDKTPDLGEMIDDIHSSSMRLISIVNDFLDVSRLEQDKIEFTMSPTNIRTVVDSVLEDLNVAKQSSDVELHNNIDTKYQVLVDPDRLKQIVYNLVGNALKFTTKGSVTLNAEVVNHVLKVFVIDTGSGIPADKQSLLFHKFQQAGADLLTRDATRGTGLGLYISRLLVDKMGGTVQLEHSKLGEGTTFSFTVPLIEKH